MIARKKKLISIEQNHVAARVARNWNGDQILTNWNCFVAANYLFDAEPLRAVIGMHVSLAIKFFREPSVIGDIIFVRQKHRAHAAHRFDLFHEVRSETRRIDQHITAFAIGSNDQITPRPKARFRIEAAIENIFRKQLGKRVDADVRIVMLESSNRTGWTSDQRHQGSLRFRFGSWLTKNDRGIAVFRKRFGRDLPARIAIDARRINIEITGDILRKS